MRRAVRAGAIVAACACACAAATQNDPRDARSSAPDAGAATTPDGADGSAAGLQPGPDPNAILDAGCATATAHVERDPIAMLVVLDGSGSMIDENKWNAVVPTLDAFFDRLAQQAAPDFGVGLTIFSDTNDATDGGGPYPALDVPVARVDPIHAAALHARLDAARPHGATPTLAVLRGQLAALEAYAPAAPPLARAKKVLVLMTDGVPYPDTDGQKGPSLDAVANALASAPPASPITTFAVGIGHYFPYDPSTYDPAFMGDLAMAGGAPNQPCAPHELQNVGNMCHFQITPAAMQSALDLEQQLRAAIDRIRSRVTSCALTLQKSDGGAPVDPTHVNVVFTASDGAVTVLVEDPKDGWTYDDPGAPTKVILHGAACARLEGDPDGAVSVVLGCRTIVK